VNKEATKLWRKWKKQKTNLFLLFLPQILLLRTLLFFLLLRLGLLPGTASNTGGFLGFSRLFLFLFDQLDAGIETGMQSYKGKSQRERDTLPERKIN
jgi:hypothetical protein